LATSTGYHHQTVYRAMRRLVKRGMVRRHREKHGQPYTYEAI